MTTNGIVETATWIDEQAVRKGAEIRDGQESGKAEGEKGMAAAAKGHASILQAAQSVARKLSANGAVTIDDVIHEMRRMGYRETDIEAGESKAKNWKGSVFADSDWVCVGSIASREKSAHGRHVRQWATKGWLKLHPVNGSQNDAAAFHLYNIYQEAAHCYPVGTELCILVGRDMLDSSLQNLAMPTALKYRPDGTVEGITYKRVYGCLVLPFNGVGAICLPRVQLDAALRGAAMLNSEVGDGRP